MEGKTQEEVAKYLESAQEVKDLQLKAVVAFTMHRYDKDIDSKSGLQVPLKESRVKDYLNT